MFGHQDDDQAMQASAATDDPQASDHSADYQASNDNNDYLDKLASDSPDQPHQETASPSEEIGSQGDSGSSDNSGDGASDTGDTDSFDNGEASTPLADDELLDIKKQALGELSPLVDHLDQTPEEKFKTTMMMIQAADNQALIPDAYKAAKNIGDEKARAQALLDIVNEINYFTHKN